MTKAKDWEYHCALLHKHDSAKFNVPTKRMRESPVVEKFGRNDFEDLVILTTCGAVLAIVVVLLVAKVMS